MYQQKIDAVLVEEVLKIKVEPAAHLAKLEAASPNQGSSNASNTLMQVSSLDRSKIKIV